MTLAHTRLDIRKVGGRIGAEIIGVDLARPIEAGRPPGSTPRWSSTRCSFFRDQHLDDEATPLRRRLRPADHRPPHRAVGRRPGQHPAGARAARAPGQLLAHRRDLRASPRPRPPRCAASSSRRTAATPCSPTPPPRTPTCPSTCGCSPTACGRCTPTTTTTPCTRSSAPSEVEQYHKVFTAQRYRTAHPVVRVHPESGTPNLFIGGFADSVIGLSRTESKDLLRLLQAYVTRPENTLRHHWAARRRGRSSTTGPPSTTPPTTTATCRANCTGSPSPATCRSAPTAAPAT